jgi:hypothetical protein
VNHLAELTDLGWYRSQTVFTEDSSEDYPLDKDPVVRRLRYDIPIYQGRCLDARNELDDSPWAVTAEDVFKLEADKKTAEELRSMGWPATPEEMDAHLRRIIPLLQGGTHRFYNPGTDEWYTLCPDAPPFSGNLEKLCKEAYLHAELWVNEESGQELWALTALREGWGTPDSEIERQVWLHACGRDAEIRLETSEDDEEAFDF